MLYFAWLICVTLQIALIELNNPALRRGLGWWFVDLLVALVPVGLVSAMVDISPSAAATSYEPQSMTLEFHSLVWFSRSCSGGNADAP
jgi:hypothetical protein